MPTRRRIPRILRTARETESGIESESATEIGAATAAVIVHLTAPVTATEIASVAMSVIVTVTGVGVTGIGTVTEIGIEAAIAAENDRGIDEATLLKNATETAHALVTARETAHVTALATVTETETGIETETETEIETETETETETGTGPRRGNGRGTSRRVGRAKRCGAAIRAPRPWRVLCCRLIRRRARSPKTARRARGEQGGVVGWGARRT